MTPNDVPAAMVLLVISLLVVCVAGGGIPGSATVKLAPRSEWDPHKAYIPARLVATLPIHVYARTTGDTEDPSARGAWATVVYRDGNSYTYSNSNHRASGRVFPFTTGGAGWDAELFYTEDNRTYTEIPSLTDTPYYTRNRTYAGIPSHIDDDKLVEVDGIFIADTSFEMHMLPTAIKGVAHKISSNEKVVLRVEHGRMWEIPKSHWNAGERALIGEDCIITEWKP